LPSGITVSARHMTSPPFVTRTIQLYHVID
jgi:hypothetical protein